MSSAMATSQQWRHVDLLVAVTMAVLFIGSADASFSDQCDDALCPAKNGTDYLYCDQHQCNYREPNCTSNCYTHVCVPGWANCDIGFNYCETDIYYDAKNCGECGMLCQQVPNAFDTGCSGGVCQPPMCRSGWGNCDNVTSNGCETNNLDDSKNCGDCGNSCEVPNAVTQCSGGMCQTPVCVSGWGDCDNVTSNGCETDIQDDANNCGQCGKSCQQVANAVTKCSGGICQTPVCLPGWANCDNNMENGCETKIIGNDAKNCGRCSKCCKQVPHAVTYCSSGICQTPVCASGWGNCDNNIQNGCETKIIGNDAKNCGRCGKCCKQVSHAVTYCSGGVCQTPVCVSGWGNCDNNIQNGCETHIGKDVKNCGKCGKCCKTSIKGAIATCSNGQCGWVCKQGTKYDKKTNCCVRAH